MSCARELSGTRISVRTPTNRTAIRISFMCRAPVCENERTSLSERPFRVSFLVCSNCHRMIPSKRPWPESRRYARLLVGPLMFPGAVPSESSGLSDRQQTGLLGRSCVARPSRPAICRTRSSERCVKRRQSHSMARHVARTHALHQPQALRSQDRGRDSRVHLPADQS